MVLEDPPRTIVRAEVDLLITPNPFQAIMVGLDITTATTVAIQGMEDEKAPTELTVKSRENTGMEIVSHLDSSKETEQLVLIFWDDNYIKRFAFISNFQ